jgi:hypothetical protein
MTDTTGRVKLQYMNMFGHIIKETTVDVAALDYVRSNLPEPMYGDVAVGICWWPRDGSEPQYFWHKKEK